MRAPILGQTVRRMSCSCTLRFSASSLVTFFWRRRRKLLARRGEFPASEVVRSLGEESPGEFFRDLIEPLCDSFDPAQAAVYERVMEVFIPREVVPPPCLPAWMTELIFPNGLIMCDPR